MGVNEDSNGVRCGECQALLSEGHHNGCSHTRRVTEELAQAGYGSDWVPAGFPEESEAVDHPAHYGGADNPYEAIKVIEAWGLDFCLGNTVKYIARAGKKGDELEDLKKARWYLTRRIEQLESL